MTTEIRRDLIHSESSDRNFLYTHMWRKVHHCFSIWNTVCSTVSLPP